MSQILLTNNLTNGLQKQHSQPNSAQNHNFDQQYQSNTQQISPIQKTQTETINNFQVTMEYLQISNSLVVTVINSLNQPISNNGSYWYTFLKDNIEICTQNNNTYQLKNIPADGCFSCQVAQEIQNISKLIGVCRLILNKPINQIQQTTSIKGSTHNQMSLAKVQAQNSTQSKKSQFSPNSLNQSVTSSLSVKSKITPQKMPTNSPLRNQDQKKLFDNSVQNLDVEYEKENVTMDIGQLNINQPILCQIVHYEYKVHKTTKLLIKSIIQQPILKQPVISVFQQFNIDNVDKPVYFPSPAKTSVNFLNNGIYSVEITFSESDEGKLMCIFARYDDLVKSLIPITYQPIESDLSDPVSLLTDCEQQSCYANQLIFNKEGAEIETQQLIFDDFQLNIVGQQVKQNVQLNYEEIDVYQFQKPLFDLVSHCKQYQLKFYQQEMLRCSWVNSLIYQQKYKLFSFDLSNSESQFQHKSPVFGQFADAMLKKSKNYVQLQTQLECFVILIDKNIPLIFNFQSEIDARRFVVKTQQKIKVLFPKNYVDLELQKQIFAMTTFQLTSFTKQINYVLFQNALKQYEFQSTDTMLPLTTGSPIRIKYTGPRENVKKGYLIFLGQDNIVIDVIRHDILTADEFTIHPAQAGLKTLYVNGQHIIQLNQMKNENDYIHYIDEVRMDEIFDELENKEFIEIKAKVKHHGRFIPAFVLYKHDNLWLVCSALRSRQLQFDVGTERIFRGPSGSKSLIISNGLQSIQLFTETLETLFELWAALSIKSKLSLYK